MGVVYYHYTSRQFAQDIHCSGRLDSPTGVNYLTPDFFESGAEAVQALAITRKPVEVAFIIAEHAVSQAIAPGAIPASTPVGPITNPVTGLIVRKGTGMEIRIQNPIPLNPLQCVNLVSP